MVPYKILDILLFLYKIMTIYTQERYLKMNLA